MTDAVVLIEGSITRIVARTALREKIMQQALEGTERQEWPTSTVKWLLDASTKRDVTRLISRPQIDMTHHCAPTDDNQEQFHLEMCGARGWTLWLVWC